MYITIIIIPMLSAIVAGFFGRHIGSRLSGQFTTLNIIVTSALSYFIFYKVALKGQPVWLEMSQWMDSEYLDLPFGLCLDTITVSMLILVTSVSALVHLYSTGYMSLDPHLSRFMAYLSFFTFFMLILVTSDNLVQLFIGWEGKHIMPQIIIYLFFFKYENPKHSLVNIRWLFITFKEDPNKEFKQYIKTNQSILRRAKYFLTSKNLNKILKKNIYCSARTTSRAVSETSNPGIDSRNIAPQFLGSHYIGKLHNKPPIGGLLPRRDNNPPKEGLLPRRDIAPQYFASHCFGERNISLGSQSRYLNNISKLKIGRVLKRNFFSLERGISSFNRIGPHNKDFLSFIIGSLLGDSHLEKKKGGQGTRIILEQCQQNVEYLIWYHKFLIERGYCPSIKPYLRKRIGPNNKIFYSYRVHSYTFTSLNWLHSLFYFNKKKIVPRESQIWDLFTPFSLAIWYMDDGCKTKSGARLSTNCFNKKDIKFLCKILKHKFNLKVNIHSSGPNKGFIIYIKASSWLDFKNLIEPYLHSSMKYKLVKNLGTKPK